MPRVGSQAHKHFVRNTVGQAGSGRDWGSPCCTAPAPLPGGPRDPEPRHWLAAASWPQSSLVLYEHLHLVNEVPGNPQDLLGIMTLSPFWGKKMGNCGDAAERAVVWVEPTLLHFHLLDS